MNAEQSEKTFTTRTTRTLCLLNMIGCEKCFYYMASSASGQDEANSVF